MYVTTYLILLEEPTGVSPTGNGMEHLKGGGTPADAKWATILRLVYTSTRLFAKIYKDRAGSIYEREKIGYPHA